MKPGHITRRPCNRSHEDSARIRAKMSGLTEGLGHKEGGTLPPSSEHCCRTYTRSDADALTGRPCPQSPQQ